MNEKKLALFFNFTFSHISDVHLLTNSKFDDHAEGIYPNYFKFKNKTETVKSASSSTLEINNEVK